jgi:signal transduction histidine kinase
MRRWRRSATIGTMRLPAGSQLQRFADLTIPWLVAVFLVLVAGDERSGSDEEAAIGLAMALGVIQGAALGWRRRHPERAMAVALIGGFAYQAVIPEIVLPVAGLLAIGPLAAARPPRNSLVWLCALVSLAASNFVTAPAEDALFAITLAVVAWALGEAARSRRVAISEEARRAVSDEQARIARELHDVIAHSVSVIVVQAAAADDVFNRRPDQARAALRSIERAGREALAELRRLLGAVRPAAGADPSAPQPGLQRVDELAEPVRAGGLEVVVRHEGDPAPLPAGVDLSAYRIVQEALTNTLRHARATRAEVLLRYRPDELEVEVRDDGREAVAQGAGGGHGLVGMRERASLLGGTLEAGPLPGGGYRVHARLPTGAAP